MASDNKLRARDLGIPLTGNTGPHNDINHTVCSPDNRAE